MKKSLSKKARKVIEEGVQEFMEMPPLTELAKIGARMMLQAAVEEEVTAYLHFLDNTTIWIPIPLENHVFSDKINRQ